MNNFRTKQRETKIFFSVFESTTNISSDAKDTIFEKFKEIYKKLWYWIELENEQNRMNLKAT